MYMKLLRESRKRPFEEVFFAEAQDNVQAMSGPYYRQATIVLCRYVAVGFKWDRLLELGDISPVNEG